LHRVSRPRCRPTFMAELERARNGGSETTIHFQQLIARPEAVAQIIIIEKALNGTQRCGETRRPSTTSSGRINPADDTLTVGYSTPMTNPCTPGFFPIDDAPIPSNPVPDRLLNDYEFITDFARFSEGILDEKFLRRKYRFSDDVWTRLGENDALIKRIE